MGYWTETTIWIARISGYASIAFLVIALSMTPLMQFKNGILRRKTKFRFAAFRRNCGIAAALFALLHTAFMLSWYLDWNFEILFTEAWLQSGFVAVCILAALWITSYPKIVRVLKMKTWKQLHILVYAVLPLSIFHVSMAPFSTFTLTLILIWVCLIWVCTRTVFLRLLTKMVGAYALKDDSAEGGTLETEIGRNGS